MVHFVSGDILLSRAHVIAHGVAPGDPMTQGLALALRQKYPSLHRDFDHWCRLHHRRPGAAWMWGASAGVRVVSLITQRAGYGEGARPGKATVQNVRDAMRSLVRLARAESFTSIAVPRLATGMGALSWNEVLPVLEERLDPLEIPVYIYAEYRPGKIAHEPDAPRLPAAAAVARAGLPSLRA